MSIVNDLKQFHTVINKMVSSMSVLEEANKDILLGKRRIDCLSCGPGTAHTENTTLSKNTFDRQIE